MTTSHTRFNPTRLSLTFVQTMALLIPLLFSTGPEPSSAQAQTAPSAHDASDSLYTKQEQMRRQAALAAFMKLLKVAPSQQESRQIESQIWEFWLIGPSKAATDQLAEAMRERSSHNYEKALALLQDLVSTYPDFTEARNQRAFVHFLQHNYDASLSDLDRVIAERPDHFAAHAGRGLVLIKQGRNRLAQAALKRARALHPWIQERHLIVEEGD